MKLNRLILIFSFLLFQNLSFGQNIDSLTQIKFEKFIPTEFEILDWTSGYLNKDMLKDFVLVLKSKNEDPDDFESEGYARPLIILIGKDSSQLSKKVQSDHLIYGLLEGPYAGSNFYSGIEIENYSLTISHYAGMSTRTATSTIFEFNEKHNDWFLKYHVETIDNIYDDQDAEVLFEIKPIKQISISDFSIDEEGGF
ncbi:MAG: hypothetical protein AB8F94_24960 [Saprospiraceae bacterium]